MNSQIALLKMLVAVNAISEDISEIDIVSSDGIVKVKIVEEENDEDEDEI